MYFQKWPCFQHSLRTNKYMCKQNIPWMFVLQFQPALCCPGDCKSFFSLSWLSLFYPERLMSFWMCNFEILTRWADFFLQCLFWNSWCGIYQKIPECHLEGSKKNMTSLRKQSSRWWKSVAYVAAGGRRAQAICAFFYISRLTFILHYESNSRVRRHNRNCVLSMETCCPPLPSFSEQDVDSPSEMEKIMFACVCSTCGADWNHLQPDSSWVCMPHISSTKTQSALTRLTG